MARQLIVCCDGTNNNLTGRLNDTNVTKLCELLAPDTQDQLLWYDPGVGNPGELPGATFGDRLSRSVERIYGLAFGKGIYENISDGYNFLVQNYQPGDQIFLYGFSRGAFTARSIGGMVTQFGLLRPHMQGLLPTLLHVYFSDREREGDKADQYKRITTQINELFCHDASRAVEVWFVGVWDTVASVGAPMFSRSITAKPSIVGKRVRHVRQALALDEQRRSFEPRPYIIEPGYDYAAAGQSIDQQWFSGSHCDVGGGYVLADTGLSDEALWWMLQGSIDCGLRMRPELHDAAGALDRQQVARALAYGSTVAGTARVQMHSESYRTPWWALAGLRLRDPAHNPDHDRPDVPVEAREHASVARLQPAFPADTVWALPRSRRDLLIAALCAFAFWLAAGSLLAPSADLSTGSAASFGSSVAQAVADAAAANTALARWQIGWAPWAHPFSSSWPLPSATPIPTHLVAALIVELGLIVAGAYLLARSTSWAFARLAGVRRVGQRVSGRLQVLGLSACVAVLADLAENTLTLLWRLTAANTVLPSIEYPIALAMSAASALKWLGLAGCVVLIALAIVHRPARQPARSPTG